MTHFEEYIRQGEPDRVTKSRIWATAIGLQQVDGLTPSAYLIETAKENIEGRITIDEVERRIESYYKKKSVRTDADNHTQEADTVSTRITKILSNNTFSFSPVEYIGIHRQLFTGIYKFAGKLRDYNITKSELVLDGKTVLYANAPEIRATLDYDLEQEKAFSYKSLSRSQIVEHLAHFVANLWQIHAFGEGNTRTTAVFLIKYLRKLGFTKIGNEQFEPHSWYFRNALVRANYENIAEGVHKTNRYLVRFFENLLLDRTHSLKNRELHLRWEENRASNDTVNVDDDTVNDTVFDLIKANPNITAEEIRVKLNVSIATVKRRIKALKDTGKISRSGSDKTGHWVILPESK